MRLAAQSDPTDYLDESIIGDSHWRSNYCSINEHASKVLDVLSEQSTRGQILKLTEARARSQYSNLVVASLRAIRKDTPCGVISARVLFDGSNKIPVNQRTRLRDQERVPVASDLKRVMRDKARRDSQPTSRKRTDGCRLIVVIGTC